ncbi:MAG: peroxiredoxin [Enterobacterales bacterium]|nr:peroxiredoxin [Enterobacterales bacterium]
MIQTNDSIPSIDLKTSLAGEVSDANTTQVFAQGKSVIFGLPGAFTPTCSKAHLPGFVVNADNIKAKGVERIACLSVNDAFVMTAWAKASNADEITMLADGNGDFSKALGLDFDGSKFGMGLRCARFAAIIDQGVLTHLFVEGPGEFEASSAENILKHL